MDEDQIKKILEQIANHESRLQLLEGIPKTTSISLVEKKVGKKQKTLREIIKGKEFNNGQEKIAVIVGYYEKVVGSFINKKDIPKIWKEAKFNGTYKTNLLDDALGNYVRVQSNGDCDLTQTGEEFFEKFLQNESPSSTSK